MVPLEQHLISSGCSVHMHTYVDIPNTHMQASTHMKIHTYLHKQSHTKNATVSSTAQNVIENI